MTTLIGILIFFAGAFVGMYGFYRRLLKREKELYKVIGADIFEMLKDEGYVIVKREDVDGQTQKEDGIGY